MRYFLPAMFATVDDQTVTVLMNALIASNPARHGEHPAHGRFILGGYIVHGGDMVIGYDEHMRRSLRIDVAKCRDEFILIENGGWQFLADNLAENCFFNHG